MQDTIISVGEFQGRPAQWLKKLHDENSVLVLTENGRADAVVQDYARFQKQQETLLMLKLLVQGEADIQANRLHAQADVFAELRAALKEPGKDV